jgi:chemotaxis protein histidine kinase CheA
VVEKGMYTNPIEGEFQEEVLRLFALEAVEWVRQIKAALLELEGAATPGRAQALYEMVLRNLTNLKGSAATVELPSIGNLAFMLVPLLQHMQKEQRVITSDYYSPLRQGLDALSSVIQVLAMAETKALVIADLESITRRQADALQNSVTKSRTLSSASVDKPGPEMSGLPTVKLIGGLLTLRRARSIAAAPTRNLVELVLRKIHALQDADSATILTASLTHLTRELHELDERFLEETRQRTSAIAAVLNELKEGVMEPSLQQKKIREALRDLALLRTSVTTVEAGEILQFLHGLEMLLTDILYKQVVLPAGRLEAVVSRLGMLLAMAQEWVDLGRRERMDIEKVLTDLSGIHFEPKSHTSSMTAPH